MSSWKGRPGALQIVRTLRDTLALSVVFNPTEYSVLLGIFQFRNSALLRFTWQFKPSPRLLEPFFLTTTCPLALAIFEVNRRAHSYFSGKKVEAFI